MSKQQLNLYRIFPSSIDAIAKSNEEKSLPTSNEERIDYIFSLVDGRRKPTELTLSNQTIDNFGSFKVRLFFCRIPTEFQWHEFFEEHLNKKSENNSDFLKCKSSSHASILCFMYSKDTIYAFTGGLGSSYIKDFVDNEFGIESLQKIADPETLQLRMERHKRVIGNVASGQQVYRGSHRTIDEDKMGKVYNEIVGEIPYNESLKKVKDLIFGNDESGQINIKAKSSIAFAKSISFSDVKIIISFLDSLPDEVNFRFSQMRALTKRRNR